MRYSLAKPYIGSEEKEAVMSVLDSGRLSLGPKIEEFEKSFASKVGTKFAVAVSSGTAGLHLSMLSAGIKPGDEVITTPFSFIASANCMLYVGAKPVFVDIDPTSYNIDPTLIESAITPKTKAILPVHIFGQSADMDSILDIAERNNLIVIEDACESLLAQYKNKNVGTFGLSSVFAFYPNKQITTGEGGMICTDSSEFASNCRSLTNQGRGVNMRWLDHTQLGYNYRMDEMSAAMGVEQLKRSDYLIEKRREVASWYTSALAPYSDIIRTPKTKEWNTNTWFVYTVEILNGADRISVIESMEKSGISTKPYLPSIHLFDMYKKRFGYGRGDFPISEGISDRSLALPFYVGLNEEDIQIIVSELVRKIK